MKRYSCFFVGVICSVIVAFGQAEQKSLGAIDLFGHKGIDVKPIEAALPFREGDPFPGDRSLPEWKQVIQQSVKQVMEHEPTDVTTVCCDDEGNWVIYIGLPGELGKQVAYNAAPNGDSRLPQHIVKLYEEIMDASREAVWEGRSGEDRSQGYSVSEDRVSRAKQLELREYALQKETTILRVLESSSDGRHRAMAAEALGYVRQSDRQIAALVQAGLDPNDEVRNNAVRALNLLAEAKPHLARRIPAGTFIDLLTSGIWSDRNKAVFLLVTLTKTRDTDLLRQLRSKALDPLVEMARWRNLGHAYPARILLGRITGMEEGRLSEMETTGQVETIIQALKAVE